MNAVRLFKFFPNILKLHSVSFADFKETVFELLIIASMFEFNSTLPKKDKEIKILLGIDLDIFNYSLWH